MKKDFLYKTAEKIWERFIKKDRSGRWYSEQVKENMERLHPFAGKEKVREHYIQKIRLSLLLCLTGFFLAGGLGISELLQPPVKDNRICRQDYGGAMQNIPVEAVTEDKERYEFQLNVRERMYGKTELKSLYENAEKELEKAILGENESLEHVEKNLDLVTELPGYPFQITWESGNYNVIDAEGKLQKEIISEEGETVGLNAVFTYEDFRAELMFYIQVYPRTMTDREAREKKILEAAKKAEEKSREDRTVLLPEEVDGERLIWRSRRSMMWAGAFIAAVCVAGLLYFLKDEDLKKEIKKRENQMLRTYPEMVSKLVVYLGAGLTLRAAWEKICADYEKGKTGKEKNPLYEEMNIACQAMKSGMSEEAAFEQFGRRCGLQLYSKFAALLTQNLRKGSTKLGSLLQEESKMAFEERKKAARKAGEEAGTKLLLPMMMMLCVVMVMILLPAFMTF